MILDEFCINNQARHYELPGVQRFRGVSITRETNLQCFVFFNSTVDFIPCSMSPVSVFALMNLNHVKFLQNESMQQVILGSSKFKTCFDQTPVAVSAS